MMRSLIRAALVIVCSAASSMPAVAQEADRGGRAELAVFPGGGLRCSSAGSASEPEFTNYAFGASFTWNVARRVGLESEAAFGIGGRTPGSADGQVLASEATPDTMGFFESVVFSPIAGRHAVDPYVNVGIGAFRLLTRNGTEPSGISSHGRTFLAGAFGGGMRWHAAAGWGVRGDYRVIAAAPRPDAPASFGRRDTRYGHRLSAAIFTTF